MAAALAAADGGARVTLVERRQRLGGLTWSFQRNGRWFDNGQHVFMRCCHHYLGFLDRIGAAGNVTLQRRLDVAVLSPGGRVAHIRRGPLPAPFHLSGALARYGHLEVADRLRLLLAAAPLRFLDPADPALDRVCFGDWLARHHQRPAAIESLWNLIVLPTVNLPAHEASLAAAAKVFRTGMLERASGGDIGWAGVPLAELHDRPGRRALDEAGVQTLLGYRVGAVRRRAGGSWTVAGSGPEIEADAVVMALPPQAAAEVVPPGTGPDAAKLGVSPIVNVHLVLDRQVTDLPFAAALRSPVQFVFDRTDRRRRADPHPAPGEREQHLVVSLSAADAVIGRRPELLVREMHDALATLFPAAHRAQLVDAVVTREHQATFRYAPGAGAHRFGPRAAIPGLAWAGAWTDTGWPATMEGAVRSGVAAASMAIGSNEQLRPGDMAPRSAPALLSTPYRHPVRVGRAGGGRSFRRRRRDATGTPSGVVAGAPAAPPIGTRPQEAAR